MTRLKPGTTQALNRRAIVTKCPVTFTIHKMGGRWKPLIIYQLLNGTMRYGELKKRIPAITEKMLIQSLKELEADGLIHRRAQPVVPPHVEYGLTECGQDLGGVMASMEKWARKYNV